MRTTEQGFDRRMPIIEVEKSGTTMRHYDGGPVTFYQADVWKKIIENAKAGKYDPPL
jgi:hypothetical protein